MGEHIQDGVPFVHAPCSNHEDTGKGCHGNLAHDGSQQKHGNQEPYGVEHTRQTCFCAGTDGNAGTGNGCCGRDAAEERQQDIAHALGDKFLIAFQSNTCHLTCAGTAEQTFNHAQNGNTEGRHDEVCDGGQIQCGKEQSFFREKGLGDGANGGHIQTNENGKGSGENDAHQRCRNHSVPFFREEHHKQHHKEANAYGSQIGMKAQCAVACQFGNGGGAFAVGAEEVVNLPQSNDDGNTGGKACDNGGRYERGQFPKTEDARQKQQDTSQQCGNEYAVQTIACHQ